jgi:hypothetical protein
VRFVIHPWIATVTQGQTDSFEGVQNENADSPPAAYAPGSCSAPCITHAISSHNLWLLLTDRLPARSICF